MPLKFIPTNVKYNDSGEFKNISIPADRAYMNEIITISSTQPTNSDNKLWISTNEQTTQAYQIPTVSESLALGINNASVGDIIRVSEVDNSGKPTSWQHVSLNEIICNKNLLDNWYFVGGGSQLGDGVFPINQRGQASYSGPSYYVDRWRSLLNDNSITLNTDYISISSSASTPTVFQDLPNPNNFTGKTLTLSALSEDGLLSLTCEIPDQLPSTAVVRSTILGDSRVNLRYIDGSIRVYLLASGAGVTAKFKAVKLELGSYQTLAHNEGTEENPNWVLNEIPDYGEELAKCQRYLQLIPASADYMVPFGYGLAMSTTEYRITIPLPTPMVKTPSITIDNCSLRFYQENLSSGSYISTYSAVSVIGGNAATLKYKPYVCLRFTVTGATTAKLATMIVTGQNGSNTRSGFLLSAED